MRSFLRGRVAAFRGRDRTRHRIDRPAGPANPYEAWVFAASTVAGAATLSRWAQPSSLDEVVTPGFRLVWAVLMTVGAAAALTGLWWPGNPFTGIAVKRTGILAMTGSLLAYGVALIAVGPAGVVAGTLVLGLAGASIARTVQITRMTRVARGRVRDLARAAGDAEDAS